MPDSFLQFVLRDTEWDPFRKIREHIIGMTPEPVRKIVGWILLIFGPDGTLYYSTFGGGGALYQITPDAF